MGESVSLDLLRLRSATSAYTAILRDVVPALEAMTALADPPELILTGADTPFADLLASVQAGLEVDDAPGTPASIRHRLAVLLGEV